MQPSCGMMDLAHKCSPKGGYRGPGDVCWQTVAFYIAGFISGNLAGFLREYRAMRARMGFPTP